MIEIIKDINNGILQSAYVKLSFPEAKGVLKNEGYRLPSLQEMAQLRLKEGFHPHVSKNGTWTKEGLIHLPGKGMFLTKNSPIMWGNNDIEATNCFKKDQEFYLTPEQVEGSLVDSIPLLIKYIPTDRLAESDIGVYAFGDLAKPYGDFLKKWGYDYLPIYNAEGAMVDKPFVRQIWLRNLSHWSAIDGDSRGFHFNGVIRGVKDLKL